MAKQAEPALPPPPPIVLKASGQNDQAAQANLITARQSPGFYFASVLIADAAMKRVDQVLLDYTRDAVAVRYQIDGLWHNMPPRDRQSGDVMLAVLKKLCDLNPGERRGKQQGKFKAEFFKMRLECSLTSQGVPTGERALIKLVDKKSSIKLESFDDLGMRDKMRDKFKEVVNSEKPFFMIISAMPGEGLTTSFRAALNASDRLLRDFVQIQSVDYPDPEVINVDPTKYDPAKGETPDKILPAVLLKQPNVLVVPDPVNGETVNILCEQVLTGDMPAYTRVNAKEAVEALLRVLAYKCDQESFAKAVTAVLNSRLCRRLCTTCKQAYQPPPQLLQKLGIPPGRVQMLYKQWEPPPPPPPDQQQKGPPPEPQICRDCGGVGYKGRFAIFELLIVTDEMRQALVKQPKLEVLRALAKQAGHRTLQEEGILAVAMGTTSLVELQRVLKQ
jgi:type II secretory ATPase GspE/PulE/Tfp pilus assembly ATPase PilB-like protein